MQLRVWEVQLAGEFLLGHCELVNGGKHARSRHKQFLLHPGASEIRMNPDDVSQPAENVVQRGKFLLECGRK